MKTQRNGDIVSNERQRLQVDVASEVPWDSSTPTSPSPSPFEPMNVNQNYPATTVQSTESSTRNAIVSCVTQSNMRNAGGTGPPAQNPMSQLPGPSPHLQHLTRGMHPPQGMDRMNAQQGPGPGNPPTAPSLFRSPNRAGTPGQGQGGTLHPNPSMAPKQPLGTWGMTAAENGINAELMHMPQSLLQQLKQEAGFATKDLSSLMLLDKQRILKLYRQRKSGGPPPPNNATLGPSNPMMQPPSTVRNKRSSTSLGEKHTDIYRNESSLIGTPNAGGTGPLSAAPGSRQNSQQQQQQQQNPGPGKAQGQIAPSPSSLLGVGPDPLSANIFSADFIQSVASSLDEFDPGIFRPDGDINFERDFGLWFNQDAMGGSLDAMK